MAVTGTNTHASLRTHPQVTEDAVTPTEEGINAGSAGCASTCYAYASLLKTVRAVWL